MPSTARNFLSVLIVGGLFIAVMIAGVVGNVRTGNLVAVPIVFTAFSIAGIAIWLSHFRVRLMLRDRTPDRIIRHYHSSVRRIPHADAASAYLSALAAAFFGQFDKAREELGAVDWERTSPMYRGHRLYVMATLALLEKTDYPAALRLAEEGKFLESKDPAGGLQVLDDVIHVVAAEGVTAESIARLERVARRQHGLMPGMCAWALGVHYKRAGESAKAAEFKELLRMAVPHSAPMQR